MTLNWQEFVVEIELYVRTFEPGYTTQIGWEVSSSGVGQVGVVDLAIGDKVIMRGAAIFVWTVDIDHISQELVDMVKMQLYAVLGGDEDLLDEEED